ncbi:MULTISPECIES: DUF5674 family protein [unclassified Nostoc]|uniref:DUF5674 family protein n=1 Tax=unclassified Nostoc TaxID=2593658 RepID=UPI000DFF02E3|nr:MULTISPECIES: DUF5674 family protein [unclassified Nostoc]MDM9580301.1 DUF5674 family protein [Nostoc sp. GT001]MDM9580462.1 DUF5674 family protein [Nostoc sp. GT001]MDZ8084299.1 DUF5674 family protein [Nostoc sp. DedQUE12b]RCJ21280.1 hypothetical protein A6S26_24640 [Nostoc sp. ATCC 43529]
MILIIREPASREEIDEMVKTWDVFIKIAVDIERKILAGGGVRHYECEQELLKDGSRQRDIWGVDWSPLTQEIVFESIINIRPSQNNRSMIIQSNQIREQVSQITKQLLGGL